MKKDLNILLNKNKFIFMLYAVMLIMFFSISNDININIFEEYLGTNLNSSASLLSVVYNIVINFSLIYLGIYLFTYDLKFSKDYLFTRQTKEKWIKNKLFSIIIVIILFSVIATVLYVVLGLMTKIELNIFEILTIMTASICIRVITQCIVLVCFCFFKYMYLVIYGLLNFAPMFIDIDNIHCLNALYASEYDSMYDISLIILVTIFCIMLAYVFVKKMFFKLLEKEYNND